METQELLKKVRKIEIKTRGLSSGHHLAFQDFASHRRPRPGSEIPHQVVQAEADEGNGQHQKNPEEDPKRM